MIKIGLLPLYIALYDEISPESRPRLEAFYERTAAELETHGFEVLRTDFCRVETEFEAAVRVFEQEGAQCLVTLHMAYSPSLESAAVLAATPLPIVVLDITDTYDFGPAQDPDAIFYCHGIHGVMDMCSLLRQNGKPFAIAAGFPQYSDVMPRAVGLIRAAVAAGSLWGSRVGTIGGAFEGMGDFFVSDEEMRERFGVTVVRAAAETLRDLAESAAEAEIDAEINRDHEQFTPIGKFSAETHARTARDALAVRQWIAQENLAALTVNFQKIGPQTGLTTMPFMEACKAMARGIGYAGEGDVLTAALMGALLRGFPDTSFVEIFCPDWRGNTLFLSHMGEMNIRLSAEKPEMAEKEFIFGKAENPVACYGCYRSGEAMYVNICRGREGFRMVMAPVAMEAETGGNFTGNIRGWMRPKMPVGTFLEELSRAGATHHSILVYGATAEQLRFFAELLRLDAVELQSGSHYERRG